MTTRPTWDKQPANRTKSPPTLCPRGLIRTGTREINIKNIQKAKKWKLDSRRQKTNWNQTVSIKNQQMNYRQQRAKGTGGNRAIDTELCSQSMVPGPTVSASCHKLRFSEGRGQQPVDRQAFKVTPRPLCGSHWPQKGFRWPSKWSKTRGVYYEFCKPKSH